MDRFGCTPISEACFMDHVEIADFLLSNGANVELGIQPPLIQAAKTDNLRQVTWLLEKGQ